MSLADDPRVAIFLSGCCVDTPEAVGFEITYGAVPELTTTAAPSLVDLGKQLCGQLLPIFIRNVLHFIIMCLKFAVDCGGVIEFNSPHDFSIEYKANDRYANNESCVWALHSGNLWEKLIVTLESEGFETGRDGIDAYYLNTTTSTLDIDFNKCSL